MKRTALCFLIAFGTSCVSKDSIKFTEPVSYNISRRIERDALVLQQFGPEKGKSLQKIYENWDLNRDGKIDFEEAEILNQVANIYRRLRSIYD